MSKKNKPQIQCEFLTVAEAAEYLGCSRSKLYHAMADPDDCPPYYRNGKGSIHFVRSELREWFLGERVQPERLDNLADSFLAMRSIASN